jgi:hypothetical protein
MVIIAGRCHWPITGLQPPLLLAADILVGQNKDGSVPEAQRLK